MIASVAWIDAEQSGQHAEDAAFGAGGHEARRRRLGVEAAVAGAALRREDRGLALEAEDRGVDVGLAEQHAGVVDEVARREVVRAVGDDVVVARRSRSAFSEVSARLVGHDLDVRVDVAQPLGRGRRASGGPTSDVP